jgi:dihydrofolate reductase
MKAIAAMEPNRVIGNGLKIPWYYSDDFKHFKRTTINQELLMGRKTYQSIGKPLPNRFTYVLTTNPCISEIMPTEGFGGLGRYVDADYILQRSEEDNKNLWVCGGAKVYEMFLPYCDEVVMTHIIDQYEGDVFMPQFEHLFPNTEILLDNKDFRVVRYSK